MNLESWRIRSDSISAFHFGRHGLGEEESGDILHSDTLFSALAARLALMRGEAELNDWTACFQSAQPLFVLSSAFPQAGSVRFFPPPLYHAPQQPGKGEVAAKKLKKVKFVSEAIFRDILGGTELSQIYLTAVALQDGEVLVSQGERGALPPSVALHGMPIWAVERRPRVTVDRITTQSEIYFTGRTVYSPECGLWFAVRWIREDAEARTLLASLLADLGDAGVGGERSSGFGSCRISADNALVLPDSGDGLWVNLSRYLPAEDEQNALQHPQAAYAIHTVGGWVQSPGQKSERRRSVRLLAEGSILGPVAKAAPGRMVDVQPDYKGNRPLGHAVWRSGMALAVGLQTGRDE